ncbi:hypothetical protein CEXT_181831 [Caerostris extrusa]|uniref:Uncharacterized protein n=1 Tax=Caerostris extrusa TaxID=172846 RepID=A0AAV4UV62_CAEEX|nr:hypothetical protein CEXT_181831 [Caerostris extrusa]
MAVFDTHTLPMPDVSNSPFPGVISALPPRMKRRKQPNSYAMHSDRESGSVFQPRRHAGKRGGKKLWSYLHYY